MALYQLDFARIFTVYIAQGLVFAVFLIIVFLILRRDKKWLNWCFSGTYLSVSIGLFLNFIYAPLTDPNVVLIMYFFTIFFIGYGLIFLVVFELILLKSEKIITRKKQLALLLIYAIALFGTIFFLDFVQINEQTGWKPVYEAPFYIYLMGIIICLSQVPTLYFAFQIHKRFEDPKLKKKWKYFIVGTFELISFMDLIFTANFINDPTFRTVIGVIGLIFSISGGYLMYYGVGKQIEK